jgi:hypothetical protein
MIRHIFTMLVGSLVIFPFISERVAAAEAWHAKIAVMGCANPRAALALARKSDPRQSDAQWLNYVIQDGRCGVLYPNEGLTVVSTSGELSEVGRVGPNLWVPSSSIERVQDPSEPRANVVSPDDAQSQPASNAGDLQSEAKFAFLMTLGRILHPSPIEKAVCLTLSLLVFVARLFFGFSQRDLYRTSPLERLVGSLMLIPVSYVLIFLSYGTLSTLASENLSVSRVNSRTATQGKSS